MIVILVGKGGRDRWMTIRLIEGRDISDRRVAVPDSRTIRHHESAAGRQILHHLGHGAHAARQRIGQRLHAVGERKHAGRLLRFFRIAPALAY